MSEQNQAESKAQAGVQVQQDVEVPEQDLRAVSGGNILMYPLVIVAIPTTFDSQQS